MLQALISPLALSTCGAVVATCYAWSNGAVSMSRHTAAALDSLFCARCMCCVTCVLQNCKKKHSLPSTPLRDPQSACMLSSSY